jgi:hypothetical protein
MNKQPVSKIAKDTVEPHYAFFGTHISSLDTTWKFNADMIRFVFEDWEKVATFVAALRNYYLEAVRCFLSGNYVGSVAASSASVEIAINLENRKRRWTSKRWLQLRACLEIAKNHGLPTDKLLISEFDLIRNKFDHGEIFPLFPLISEKLGSAHWENPNFAIEQLSLAHGFLVALYAQEQPKVDREKEQQMAEETQ